MSNYKKKEVMAYLTRKPVTSEDIKIAQERLIQQQPFYQQTPELVQDDIARPQTGSIPLYQNVQPGVAIQETLPTYAPPDMSPTMPSAKDVPNPQFNILELADGGRIQFARGSDPEKIARIENLIKSGKYNKAQIINILKEEGYGLTRTGKDSIINKIADDLKINLPVGMTEKGLASHEAKGKYLPFYNNAKLEVDLKKGKTLQDIGKDLFENNKKFYNQIGITEDNISILNNAISSKIRKNEDFIKLHDKNINENVKQQKQVLKDVDSFIKTNKQKYLNLYNQNKIGAPTQFKNDLIDFIEKKHPDYVKITTTYNPKNPLPKGSKVLDLPDIHEREITRAGDYGRDVYLKKKIRESLGIPERPLKGEGITKERLDRRYNITTQELLKKAQEEGIIPKTYTTKTGVKVPINNEASYYNYAKQMGVDPINKLFEGQIQFGLEHVGGIARAGKINDYETLNKALAFDSYTNRFIKGNSFDSRLTTLIELAKQAEPIKAKEYVKTINNLVTKAEEQYGIPLTRYKIVKDEITAIHPDISLTDSNFKKAKLAINSFITNDGLNHPNFEKLDTDLQKTIVNYSKDKTKEADDLLKGLLKQKGLSAEIIPGMRSIIDSKIFNNLVEAGSPAVNSIIKNSSNISKTTGLPFNAALGALLNFDEMQEKGLSVPDSIKYGAIKGAVDDVLNFGAQIISAGPLMTKTLFDATIAAKQQPPEGIDSFDQIGGKQSLQGKVLNEIFNIAPFQVGNIFAAEKAKELPTKERIDNLVNFETRKIMEQLYPAPDISETEVPGQNNIMQQQEQEIKKNLYQKYFEDSKIKEEYEKSEPLKKDPFSNVIVGPIAFPKYTQEELNLAYGGRVKYADGTQEDDLYIPPLNKPDTTIREGVLSLATGGRVGFGGGGPATIKFARMITDLLGSLKKDLSFSSHLEKLYGPEYAKKHTTSPYKIPEGTNKSRQSDILMRIDEIKQNLPKEYSGLTNTLDDIEKKVSDHNYIDAYKKGTNLLDNLPESFNFEKLPQELFPMEDPLNSAFIIFDPKREKMVGRYTMRYAVDPETGKGIIQTYDTYDPASKKFLEEKDWKLIGVDAREESGEITKKGLN